MKLRKETKAPQPPRHDSCPQCGQPIPKEPKPHDLIVRVLSVVAIVACLMVLNFYLTGKWPWPDQSQGCLIR